jgi:hypothetical protein
MVDIDKIEIIFKDDGSFFSEVGQDIKIDDLNKGLNLDIGVLYKKSALSDCVSYLIRKYNLQNDTVIKKTLAFILLVSIYPTITRVLFSDENNFETIRSFLTNEMGTQYFIKSDVQNNLALNNLVVLLIREGFLDEDGDRYYFNGYYLESLKISNL